MKLGWIFIAVRIVRIQIRTFSKVGSRSGQKSFGSATLMIREETFIKESTGIWVQCTVQCTLTQNSVSPVCTHLTLIAAPNKGRGRGTVWEAQYLEIKWPKKFANLKWTPASFTADLKKNMWLNTCRGMSLMRRKLWKPALNFDASYAHCRLNDQKSLLTLKWTPVNFTADRIKRVSKIWGYDEAKNLETLNFDASHAHCSSWRRGGGGGFTEYGVE
jgi:hypothetical protein